jgi:enoyl-[acyl-carrier protein] reductase/trans-2-enoyl-CoA reductase (NAD+)
MIITPSIRSNVFLNAHPEGCKVFVSESIKNAQSLPQFDGPKKVLIIGGSSGYGFASRVALAVASKAHTINVSFESAPSNKRTGTAGYYNNVFFQQQMKDSGQMHIDVVMDAFSQATKDKVVELIKTHFGEVDLVIYSLASGVRPDPNTNSLVRSALKPIGQPLEGDTLDVATKTMKTLYMEAATEEDIKNTVFVMGGSDWESWMHTLDENHVLSKNSKTISYTYVGSGSMDKIYRAGTIGKAKDDLEATANRLQKLMQPYQGEALISSSKAVVTKASVFIPGITSYIACLFDVMKEKNVHETIVEHKHRLFKDMVYGNKRLIDSIGRIRIDHYEMQEDIQKDTLKLLSEADILSLQGTEDFLKEFHHIHGFGYDQVNYDEDIDLESLDLSNTHIITQ